MSLKKSVARVLNDAGYRLYRGETNFRFADEIAMRLNQIPQSRASRIYRKSEARVGFISDRFLYENYKDSCDLVYITPLNWDTLKESLDCLIVTSAWHGLAHEWEGIYRADGNSHAQLRRICSQAAQMGIPVGFYSKEDPPNFSVFQNVAALADVIFTSAKECVAEYRKIFPDKECFCLPFCVNPLLHNPVGCGSFRFPGQVLFAGSYMRKYPERTKQQKKLIDLLLRSGLSVTILDRNYSRKDFLYYYPLRYRKYVTLSFDYRRLSGVYKMFPFVLNLNSVTNSETMFASRVYDASATGALLISNDSAGMRKRFPSVAVSEEEIIEMIHAADAEERREQAIRSAFAQNTVFEQIRRMLRKLHVRAGNCPVVYPVVDVIVPQKTDSLLKQFHAQTYPYKRIYSRDQAGASEGEIVTFWDIGERYSPYALESAVNAFKYTDCDYVTAEAEVYHRDYTDTVRSKSRTFFWKGSQRAAVFERARSGERLENGYSL